MWERILDETLHRLVRHGRIELTLPDGRRRSYGQRAMAPRPFEAPRTAYVTIHDPAVPRQMVLNPQLGLTEAWMDGRLTIEGDDIAALIATLAHNTAQGPVGAMRWSYALAMARRRIDQANARAASRRNVRAHYDLTGALYDLFLDEDRQYSCAYFDRPGLTLDQAQAAKKAHIAKKLRLAPGMRVLDIGCGWGGLAITLARDHGAHVLGVTLSHEQHDLARARVAEAGLQDRVDIRLRDYRDVKGPFDRIVSVGMFEHVGLPNYAAYFGAVHDLLAPDGVALIHTIGRTGPPGITSPFIAKYIFPGGYIPALSEVSAAVERTPLELCDLEVWRYHYAETLKHWHDRFMARADEAEAMMGARFVRMWRWYLIGSEMTFRHHRQAVFQVQLARRKDAVPVTRAYLHGGEAVTAEEIARR